MRDHGNCTCKMGIFWRNTLYDALYCPECKVWVEPTCWDTTCEYCVNRPDTPPKFIEDANGRYYLFDDGTKVEAPEF